MKQRTLLVLIKPTITWLAFSLFSVAALGYESTCKNSETPIIENEPLVLISSHFKFLEGPTWSTLHKKFYFSEMNFDKPQTHGPESTIYSLNLPNNINTVKRNSGTNGLLAKGDYLYTMNHGGRALTKLHINTLESTTLSTGLKNQRFNSPNDLVIAKNGVIYFTDPDWQLGDREKEIPYTGLYAYLANDKTLLLDKTLNKPNGLALSLNQQLLFVGDASNNIYQYDINTDGTLSNRRLFTRVNSPDGITLDCAGNLYVASHNKGSINIYTDTGKLLDQIFVGHKVTNVAFGGATGKTLLITSAAGLYRINLKNSGAN